MRRKIITQKIIAKMYNIINNNKTRNDNIKNDYRLSYSVPDFISTI
jgi:hypothetical protein